MDVFGIAARSSNSEDFMAYLKYDARAGIFTRVDRALGNDGYENTDTVLEWREFGAVFDLDNLETGWISFTAGAPSYAVVPLATLEQTGKPAQPSEQHKEGIRLVIKLAAPIAGSSAIRELASTAAAFRQGLEPVYLQYKAERAAHPGMLPVVKLEGTPLPVKTGSGQMISTNYRPRFRIDKWVARPVDLVPRLKGVPAAQSPGSFAPAPGNGSPVGAGDRQRPATGSRPAAPPPPPVATYSDSDFG
jgi:hypothetical protein